MLLKQALFRVPLYIDAAEAKRKAELEKVAAEKAAAEKGT